MVKLLVNGLLLLLLLALSRELSSPMLALLRMPIKPLAKLMLLSVPILLDPTSNVMQRLMLVML